MITEEQSDISFRIKHGTDTLLLLKKLAPKVYTISSVASPEDARILEILISKFQDFCNREDAEILSSDHIKYADTNLFLAKTDLAVIRSKQFFHKDLCAYADVHADPFSYSSIFETGEELFLEAFDRITADDKERTGSARQFFDELKEMAGAALESSNWLMAYFKKEPIGIVLPQPYEDAPEEGSIFYVGILPEHRGKGFGTILHAKGLSALKQLGCSSYIGSTDVSNTAMLKVFHSNGCDQKPAQLFYKIISAEI